LIIPNGCGGLFPVHRAGRRAAAAFPDDEPGGQPFNPARQARIGDPLKQHGASPLAEEPHRLVDRRQRRGEHGTEVNVVEPGH
jgi:hypothetical protein